MRTPPDDDENDEEQETVPGRPNLTGWRKRLRDEDDQPLPEDSTRVDVTTGKRVDA